MLERIKQRHPTPHHRPAFTSIGKSCRDIMHKDRARLRSTGYGDLRAGLVARKNLTLNVSILGRPSFDCKNLTIDVRFLYEKRPERD
jgi:hypothetical protein